MDEPKYLDHHCCPWCNWRGSDFTAWTEHATADHLDRFAVLQEVGVEQGTVVLVASFPSTKQDAPATTPDPTFDWIEIDNPEIRCPLGCGTLCVDASTQERPEGVSPSSSDEERDNLVADAPREVVAKMTECVRSAFRAGLRRAAEIVMAHETEEYEQLPPKAKLLAGLHLSAIERAIEAEAQEADRA